MRTRVGYAGGTRKNPTYHSIGDHTESIQIEYDPEKVSFEKLVELFWQGHDPTSRPWSRQYQAILFYHDAEQERVARETKERVAARLKTRVHTEVLPAGTFYLAEDYHQKYRLRSDAGLFRELRAIYPDGLSFVNSTAAARLNGYLDGYGDPETIALEADRLGLSPAGKQRFLDQVGARRGPRVRCRR